MNKTLRLFLVLLLLVSTPSARAEITITDIAGRTITLPKEANKIALGEGRFISILSVLGIPDPIDRIAGMMNEFRVYDPDGFAAYQAAYPHIEHIPNFGHTSEQSVSVEQLILLKPDAVVFGLSGHGPGLGSTQIIDTLEAANIPVVFIDFRQDPIANTVRSIEIVGHLLGENQRTEKTVEFYRSRLQTIANRVSQIPPQQFPTVLFDLKANQSQECCLSVAKGLFADLAKFAGGRSLANGLLPGDTGQLSLEHILSTPFDHYIGTAIGSTSDPKRQGNLLLAGVGIDSQLAQQSIKPMISNRHLSSSKAVANGQAHLLWHHFYNSPLNLYAIEKMATWFHPNVFKDINPEQTLKELLGAAKPVELDGTYAASINLGDDQK